MEWRRTTAAMAVMVMAGSVGVTAAAPAAQAGAAAATVRTGGGWLNVRDNASTWNTPRGRLFDGAPVAARCQLGGELVRGRERTTSLWLRIGDGRYVSDAYVAWSPDRPRLPWCHQAGRAPTGQAAFIRWAAQRAEVSHRQYGIPVSVTVAQAINESGWGRSGLARQGNAYFGIKCFGIPGPLAAGCRPYATSECNRYGCGPFVATFRVYRWAERSFRDHGRFLRVNPRYAPAFAHTENPDRFAREIHKAGYATDPGYSDKLTALMRQYRLYRFDR